MDDDSLTSLARRDPPERDRAGADDVPTTEGSAKDVKIQWALVDDKLVSIHSVPDGQSTRCRCLVCERKLIPRRGPKTSWHFAHEKGAPPCPLHSEEVLKRFQAKVHLKKGLETLTSLEIVVTCRSRRGTQARHLTVPLNWVSAWDEVTVDFSADGTGPDVLLLFAGSRVAAIEVRGSDPIGAGKEAALRRLAAPWAESSAEEILKWTPGTSLPVYRLEPEGWQCAFCQAKEHASGPRAPQAEVYDARLTELRHAGLRLLWAKEYNAVFDERSWRLELHICDLIDELGVPLHRLLVNGEYDFVVAGVTAEELASVSTKPESASRTASGIGPSPWRRSESE